MLARRLRSARSVTTRWCGGPRTCAALWLALCACAVTVGSARADDVRGHTRSGLSGVLDVIAPRSPEGTVLSSGLGYGLSESFGRVPGVHQRLLGTLGVAHTPLPWLSIAGHVQGRLDFHPRDRLGADRTGTGDPYLSLRAGKLLDAASSAGVLLSAWIPGRNAPSLAGSATTLELRALYARTLRPSLRLLANLGFRLDESAHAAPELARLRPGDRSALGLSDYHGLPWGVALDWQALPELDAFAQLAGLFLLSTRSEVLAASPLRVALGARRYLPHALELEGALSVSLAQRPSFAASAPLVPYEPRVLFTLGLRWDGSRARAQAVAAERLAAATRPTRVRGVIHDDQGAAMPDATVTLSFGEQSYEAVTAYDGSFELAGITGRGPATLDVRARGYLPEVREVTLDGGELSLPPSALVRSITPSALRVVVRTFDGAGLRAQVLVLGPRGRRITRANTDRDGALELGLPPGDYQVTVSSAGYRSQTTSVHVDQDGVAIVNVDLRGRAP